MTQRIHLMDLSEEVLLEIAAWVPYSASTWFNLTLVNRRFYRLMTTACLPAKAADYQFNPLYRLLPTQRLSGNPLRRCLYWATKARRREHRTGMSRQCHELLRTGDALILAIRLQMKALNGSESANLGRPSVKGSPQLHSLRLLRMLPIDAHWLLRYTNLRCYKLEEEADETLFWPGDAMYLYCQHPQSQLETQEALRSVYIFLAYEVHTLFPDVDDKSDPGDPPNEEEIRDLEFIPAFTETLRDQRLPIEHTGRFLPSAMTLTLAMLWLKDRPPSYATLRDKGIELPPNPCQDVTGNARTEAVRQLNIMRDLCQQIEAEDGRYPHELLRKLDLEAIRATIVSEARAVTKMSENEVQEGLREELEFLIGPLT